MIGWILGFIENRTEALEFPAKVKLCGLALYLTAGGIATSYLTDDSLSRDATIGLSLLRWTALLLAAPIYTVCSAIGVAALGLLATFVDVNFRHINPNFDFWFITGFRVLRIAGYTWAGAKLCYYVIEAVAYAEEHSPSGIAAQEKLMREIQEGKDRELSAERAKTQSEFKEIVASMAELVSTAGSPTLEMIRVTGVVEGDTDGQRFADSPEEILVRGTLQILSAISQAHGSVPNGIVRLYHAIRGRLEPQWRFTADTCAEQLEENRIGSKIGVPLMVVLLEKYDRAQGTGLCARAASIHCSLIRAAAGFCGSSVAVKIVADGYIALLSQYLRGSREGDDGAGSDSSSGSSGGANGNQSVLSRSYEILEVASDATDEEVKSAYRDLTKIWHPDRFSEKDGRLREKAAGKFREMQEAYEIIKGSRNGGSPPPPKRQTASTDSHSPDEDIDYVKRRIDECRVGIQAFLVSLKAGHASSGDWAEMLQRQDEAARQLRDVLARIRRSAPSALSSLGRKLVILETRTARLRDLYEWASEDEMMALTVLPDGSLVP